MKDLLVKFKAAMLWHALGDALGAPFEGQSMFETCDMTKEFIITQEKYYYTDDTIMMLCIARAIVRKGEFSQEEILKEYIKAYTSHEIRGIGFTTDKALSRYVTTGVFPPGVIDKFAAGNGVAMRVTPIALFDSFKDYSILYEHIRQDAYLTHRNELAISGAFAVAIAIKEALFLSNKMKVVSKVLEILENFGIENRVYDAICKAISLAREGGDHLENLSKIGNSGYVVESVSNALYCFIVSNNPLDAVILAIRSGGDTDTNAAITGAISGAFYAEIPHNLMTKLESADEIETLALKIYKLAKKSANNIQKNDKNRL